RNEVGGVAFAGDPLAKASTKAAASGEIHKALNTAINAAGERAGVDVAQLTQLNKDMSFMLKIKDVLADRSSKAAGGGTGLGNLISNIAIPTAMGGGLAISGGVPGALAGAAIGLGAVGVKKLALPALRATDYQLARLVQAARGGSTTAQVAQLATELGLSASVGEQIAQKVQGGPDSGVPLAGGQ
ncbi:MAG TPA: hypothetical protein VFH73_00025, partial [Polyangia bacterium]|nr:hypothetical protein [Polyangia bacterium]